VEVEEIDVAACSAEVRGFFADRKLEDVELAVKAAAVTAGEGVGGKMGDVAEVGDGETVVVVDEGRTIRYASEIT